MRAAWLGGTGTSEISQKKKKKEGEDAKGDLEKQGAAANRRGNRKQTKHWVGEGRPYCTGNCMLHTRIEIRLPWT